MNVWRWLGISIFLLGAVCLIGTTKIPAFAGGKDKDAKVVDKKDDDKKEVKKGDDKKEVKKDDDKKEVKKDDDKKEVKKDDDKKEVKKDDDKKEVKKVDPPAKGALSFTAFDPKSKAFFQEQVTETKQTMKVMGQSVEQVQKQTFIIQWTPKELDKDKNLVVAQKIVGVKMDINIGGNKIAYDSTQPNKQKNPMTDFFEQLTKQELVFTIKPDLSQVVSIAGREEFIKGLSDINPQMQSLLKAILSDKALTKMAEPTWYAFPPGGSLDNKTWTRKSELDLGPIGKYNTTFNLTYAGPEGTKDKIDIKTNLEYSAPTDKAGLPFIIHEAKLTTTDGKGAALFDRSKGRFESTSIDMKLNGTLTIEVGNMKTTVELTQTQTAKSTTTDENPWDKK